MMPANHQCAMVAVVYALSYGMAGADNLIGYELIPRPFDDANAGNVHVLIDGFENEGVVGVWAFHDDDDTAPDPNRTITPLVLEVDGNGDIMIVGIGTPRETNEAGAQGDHVFDLVVGEDWMSPNRRFGWFDGSTDAGANAGAIDYGPPAAGEPGIAVVTATTGDITVGTNLGAPTFFQRTYSIMVNVVPPQAECDPPALPDADDQSMHVIEQTPPWINAEFGTYLDEQGVEQPFNVRYHVADNPVGLVYVFHGGGGGASFSENLDPVDILNLLIEHGFAFVATESTDRVDKIWDSRPTDATHTNADYDRMINLRDALIANTALTADAPLFAYGFSSGSKFAGAFSIMTLANGLDFRAIAANSTSGTPMYKQFVVDELDVPAFFVVGANETKRICNIENFRDDLAARNLPAELHINQEKALNPDRFNRIPQIESNPGLAQQLFDLLVDGVPNPPQGPPLPGVIDAQGVRSVNCDVQNGLLNDLIDYMGDVIGLSESVTSAIDRQMKIAWAQHKATSEFRQAQLEFFLHALRPTDLDLDGLVNASDLAQLLAAWGPCARQPCWADVNHDGTVNAADLAILLASWT